MSRMRLWQTQALCKVDETYEMSTSEPAFKENVSKILLSYNLIPLHRTKLYISDAPPLLTRATSLKITVKTFSN